MTCCRQFFGHDSLVDPVDPLFERESRNDVGELKEVIISEVPSAGCGRPC